MSIKMKKHDEKKRKTEGSAEEVVRRGREGYVHGDVGAAAGVSGESLVVTTSDDQVNHAVLKMELMKNKLPAYLQ